MTGASPETKPTIDEMKQQLLDRGWKPKTPVIWKSPKGTLFLGPVGAWKVMKVQEIPVAAEEGSMTQETKVDALPIVRHLHAVYQTTYANAHCNGGRGVMESDGIAEQAEAKVLADYLALAQQAAYERGVSDTKSPLPPEAEAQSMRSAEWFRGFEAAHELNPCGHSRGDDRDPDYKPGQQICNTSCVGCASVQAAYERAAQVIDTELKERGMTHDAAGHRIDILNPLDELARRIRALGSASALELALAQRAREEREKCATELSDAYPEKVFTPLAGEEVKAIVSSMEDTVPNASSRMHASWARHLAKMLRDASASQP